MKKNLFFFLLVTFSVSVLQAQPAEGYYDAAEGKKEAQLKTALYTIISKNYKQWHYSDLYDIYETSDNTEDNEVWDMYSTCTWNHHKKNCGSYKNVCDCYNREHSIPQSWFDEDYPMKSDAFHVYPTDGKTNGMRSNHPFGECANGKTLPRSKGRWGSSTFPGYNGTVFEPVDEYKGDFARTYFYFATRYENIMNRIGGESFNGTTYPAFSTWSLNLFLKWHREDPVSQKEIDRNNAIEAWQRNRNPFIDHPELAEFIWGERKGEVWTINTGIEDIIIEFAIYPNPVVDNLYIKTEETGLQYTIYSISGQVLQSGTIESDSPIGISGMINGMYLLELTKDNRRTVQKFIISK